MLSHDIIQKIVFDFTLLESTFEILSKTLPISKLWYDALKYGCEKKKIIHLSTWCIFTNKRYFIGYNYITIDNIKILYDQNRGLCSILCMAMEHNDFDIMFNKLRNLNKFVKICMDYKEEKYYSHNKDCLLIINKIMNYLLSITLTWPTLPNYPKSYRNVIDVCGIFSDILHQKILEINGTIKFNNIIFQEDVEEQDERLLQYDDGWTFPFADVSKKYPYKESSDIRFDKYIKLKREVDTQNFASYAFRRILR